MKIYKDKNNNLFAYEIDGTQDNIIPSDYKLLIDEEAEAIRASKIVLPTYQELRAAEYPPMSDYLDGIAKGNQAQVQTYIDACLAVKAKYPKEAL